MENARDIEDKRYNGTTKRILQLNEWFSLQCYYTMYAIRPQYFRSLLVHFMRSWARCILWRRNKEEKCDITLPWWQNFSISAIFLDAPGYCRITPLLYELHWLPVKQRISFKILLFVFKAIHGFPPTYLRELVSTKRSRNYNLRSSSDGLLLATPTYRSRVTLGDRSFQVAAPALWNVLPREIRSITDLGIFKCHLKTHLFREAFY